MRIMAILVEYSEKLQRAVDSVIAPLGIKERQAPYRNGHSTFTARRGGSVSNEYDGMWKLILHTVDEKDEEGNVKAVNAYLGAVNGSGTYTFDEQNKKFIGTIDNQCIIGDYYLRINACTLEVDLSKFDYYHSAVNAVYLCFDRYSTQPLYLAIKYSNGDVYPPLLTDVEYVTLGYLTKEVGQYYPTIKQTADSLGDIVRGYIFNSQPWAQDFTDSSINYVRAILIKSKNSNNNNATYKCRVVICCMPEYWRLVSCNSQGNVTHPTSQADINVYVNAKRYSIPAFDTGYFDATAGTEIFAFKYTRKRWDKDAKIMIDPKIEVVQLSKHNPPYSDIPEDDDKYSWKGICKVNCADSVKGDVCLRHYDTQTPVVINVWGFCGSEQ